MSKHINEVVLELEQKREDAKRKAGRTKDIDPVVLYNFYLGEAEGYRRALLLLEDVE